MILIIGSLSAGLVDDALTAYNSGDKQKAIKLWIKTCDDGSSRACKNLGVLYERGEGVRQDKQKASKLYTKACDGGNLRGCKNYRILNEQGIN